MAPGYPRRRNRTRTSVTALKDIRPGLTSRATVAHITGELFEHTGRIVDLLEACLRLVPKVADILALRYFSHVYDEPHTTVMT